jgi:hypothetical protein
MVPAPSWTFPFLGNWRQKANTQALLMLTNTAADYRPPNVWRDHMWMLELLHPRYVDGAPVRILQGG